MCSPSHVVRIIETLLATGSTRLTGLADWRSQKTKNALFMVLKNPAVWCVVLMIDEADSERGWVGDLSEMTLYVVRGGDSG
jgi:hypothetical protein